MQKFYPFILSLFFILLSACQQKPPTMPVEPAQFEKFEEYYFGHPTDSFDHHAWGLVWDQANALYDGEFSFEPSIMNADIDWELIENHYEMILLPDDGWEPELTVSAMSSDYQVFAIKNGKYFFAVVGLTAAHEQGGYIPVNVITNIPEA